jgi:hypothetical protein
MADPVGDGRHLDGAHFFGQSGMGSFAIKGLEAAAKPYNCAKSDNGANAIKPRH